jgi:hypothetical protein
LLNGLQSFNLSISQSFVFLTFASWIGSKEQSNSQARCRETHAAAVMPISVVSSPAISFVCSPSHIPPAATSQRISIHHQIPPFIALHLLPQPGRLPCCPEQRNPRLIDAPLPPLPEFLLEISTLLPVIFQACRGFREIPAIICTMFGGHQRTKENDEDQEVEEVLEKTPEEQLVNRRIGDSQKGARLSVYKGLLLLT